MTAPTVTHDTTLSVLHDLVGTDVDDLEPLRPGAWSSAWSFTHDGASYVIRFSAVRDDFERDAFAPRFASPRLPIPAVTHRGRLGDLYMAVSERIHGGFLDELDGPALLRTLPGLLKTLDALRMADTSGTRSFGGWDAGGNGSFRSWAEALRVGLQDRPGDRGAGWRAKLEASPSGASAFDRDLAVFERFLPFVPAHRHVLHADLINFNCFVEDDRVSGVIDWGCAMYGDHLYELAWFDFWSPWHPQWADIDVAGSALRFFEAQGADMTHASERFTCYLLHIGLGHQAYNASIGDMDALADVIRRTTQIADKVR